MKEETISKLIACLILGGMLSALCYIMYNISTDDYYDKEYLVVEGTVIEVIPAIGDDGSIEYYHVYFDTGEKYRIKTAVRELDLTVNSKLIIELYWYPNQGEDFKFISQIVKVPENPGVIV